MARRRGNRRVGQAASVPGGSGEGLTYEHAVVKTLWKVSGPPGAARRVLRQPSIVGTKWSLDNQLAVAGGASCCTLLAPWLQAKRLGSPPSPPFGQGENLKLHPASLLFTSSAMRLCLARASLCQSRPRHPLPASSTSGIPATAYRQPRPTHNWPTPLTVTSRNCVSMRNRT